MRITTMLVIAAFLAVLGASAAYAQQACETFSGIEYTVTVCKNDATPTATATSTSVPTMAPTSTPVPTDTPVAPTPTPTLPPVIQSTDGIWISRAEIAGLPRSGAAWSDVQSYAGRSCTPDLSNQDDACNVIILAKAYNYVATGSTQSLGQVVDALRAVTSGSTESGGRTLALGRELAAYVIAADLIRLKDVDPSLDVVFRAKLKELLTKALDGKPLISCHEVRPNNWGTMCGGSRAAVAAYLGDETQLDRIAKVFEGYLGNRAAYASFDYGELSWQCNSSAPVGINPAGCIRSGHSIDGALPEEMRRAGGFTWPPGETGYAWEGLQGAVVQAEILQRAGYPAWQWENRALCRAVKFLHDIGWEADGDDPWQIPLVNYRCGTNFTASGIGSPGKIMGFTWWTHSASAIASPLADPIPQVDDGVTERRVVADSDMVSLFEEVEALKKFGWVPVGELQYTSDADGKNIYMQALER